MTRAAASRPGRYSRPGQSDEPGARRCVVGQRGAELRKRSRQTLDRPERLPCRELGQAPPLARVGERVGHEMIVGDRPSPAGGCRPGGRFPELAGQRGERVGTGEVGVAQRQVVRMHGGAAMRQEAGRLEQRQPGAQPGSDGVRSGSDRCLEPGHGVLRPGERDEQHLAGADRLGLAVRWRLLFVPARGNASSSSSIAARGFGRDAIHTI